MAYDPQHTLVHISRDTHNKLKKINEKTSIPLKYLVDLALDAYAEKNNINLDE